VRHGDFEDKQGDSDGEDAVAKRLQASRVVVVALVVCDGGVAFYVGAFPATISSRKARLTKSEFR